jgi:hypothetical protein
MLRSLSQWRWIPPPRELRCPGKLRPGLRTIPEIQILHWHILSLCGGKTGMRVALPART